MNKDYSESNNTKSSSSLESTAFYVLLATVILAPLAFFPTPYIIIDAVKTVLIAVGTIISAILYAIISYKERSVVLPPRSIVWTSVLVVISLAISSYLSINMGKSIFGQGFEINTVSFILVLFLAGLITFIALQRKIERATVLYIGIAVPFIILAIIHGARLLLGPSFMSLGVLSSLTSTLVGTWFDLGLYSIIIAMVSLSAIVFLPLSRLIKFVYWVLLLVGLAVALLVNNSSAWLVAGIVLFGFTIVTSITRSKDIDGGSRSFFKRIAWFPLLLCVIAVLLSWKGTTVVGPTIAKLDVSYNALVLPWQLTLDVDTGVIKDRPLFGVGPNNFSQAYIAYKPIAINSTNVWSAEFSYAFSLFATFIATQGVFGIITWLLFFVFLGILWVRVLRNIPNDSHARFIITSSVSVSVFLWIMAMVSVTSHSILLFMFIMTAIGLSAGVKYSLLSPYTLEPRIGSYSSKLLSVVILLLVVVGVVWGSVYVKDVSALGYFGSGVKALNIDGDPIMADTLFSKAQKLNNSDIYLRARAEAGISQANKLMATVTATTPASTSQAIAVQVVEIINSSIKYAQAAILNDPNNYYNYVSEARVSEIATGIRMEKAYENAVNSYTNAIRANPLNPSLYLNLAQLQASQNKLDDARKTIGAALQVKNNYLEAIFLLSQIEAARGNLADAIIAAKVAVEINSQNPVLLFQLGLLHYNNKEYADAAKSLEATLKIQPEYANAQYFLGLSYVRLNKMDDAITQFINLAKTNPDNQEIAFILENLQSGNSPFADAKPPVTPTPEKRSSLPIKEKKK